MLKRGRVLISAFAVFASVVLVAIDPGIAQGQAGPFCDGFEDGSAIPSQWTVYQGYQTLVGSPTHSGDSSLEFHGGCHSSIYRTGFEAGYGEYSVWVNQQHSTGHFSVYTQFAVGSSPDPNPIGHIGYQLSLSATNSDGNQFYVNRDSNGVETRLGTGIGQFVLGEWIRVFVRRLPYGVIVAGYERTAGLPLRDSLICFDPNSFSFLDPAEVGLRGIA
ncbi:MAG: hypothetical protein HZB43_00790 [candidate division Zixibacteria bacterium]|nr:hypothetical protein [candidate division Zixibacteria bacterium]